MFGKKLIIQKGKQNQQAELKSVLRCYTAISVVNGPMSSDGGDAISIMSATYET